MELSAPFMHDPPCSSSLWAWSRGVHEAPIASSRFQQSLSRLFRSPPAEPSVFLRTRVISVTFSRQEVSSVSGEPLSSSGFNWEQLNPLFPHFSQFFVC